MCEMEMKIKATSPCAKFYKTELGVQVEKIMEEVEEVRDALYIFQQAGKGKNIEAIKAAAIDLLVELYDVVACTNTMFSQLKFRYPNYFDHEAFVRAEASVINKNMARGYYATEE